MKRSILVLAGLATFAAGCSRADQSAAAVEAVRAADQAWLKAFSARDTAATLAVIEPTGSVASPNAPISTGPEAIKTLFAGFWALPAMTIKWDPTTVHAARSGELAYTSGPYELTFTDPKGNAVTDKGKYVTVWHKQADGTWRVAIDIFNSDLPAPGM